MSWNYAPTSTATAPATNTSCSQQVPAHCQHCLRNQNLRVWLVNLHWKCGIGFPPNVARKICFHPALAPTRGGPCFFVAFLRRLRDLRGNPNSSLASRDPGIPGMIPIYKSTISTDQRLPSSGPPPKSRIGDRQLETSLANEFWANLSIFLYLNLRFPCWCKVPLIQKNVFIFSISAVCLRLLFWPDWRRNHPLKKGKSRILSNSGSSGYKAGPYQL